MANRFAFNGGDSGRWRVRSMHAVRGEGLRTVTQLDIAPVEDSDRPAAWTLLGQISNVRYATRAEVGALQSKQEPLNRPAALRAALIPIRKSPAWWSLAQDERRTIFEDRSSHTAIGLQYLPAVARQLYHCRDLGEPFDFLTWFEYAPEHAAAFEELVAALRATAEWTYVEREVDIRLERA
jgi:chlorite dismutase